MFLTGKNDYFSTGSNSTYTGPLIIIFFLDTLPKKELYFQSGQIRPERSFLVDR